MFIFHLLQPKAKSSVQELLFNYHGQWSIGILFLPFFLSSIFSFSPFLVAIKARGSAYSVQDYIWKLVTDQPVNIDFDILQCSFTIYTVTLMGLGQFFFLLLFSIIE